MFASLAQDLDSLDERAGSFVEALWEECESKCFASQALAGIQHFLGRRRCLPRVWFLVETWNIHDMLGRAPPLLPVVVYVLVGRALHEGQLGLAAGLALNLATFLRTGEMLSAQYQHVAVFEGAGTIALPLTKVDKRRGHQEMVPFECAIAVRLLVRAAMADMVVKPSFPPQRQLFERG